METELDFYEMTEREKRIYALGIDIGYIVGLNKGTIETMIDEGYCPMHDPNTWLEEIESKIALIEKKMGFCFGAEEAETKLEEIAEDIKEEN